MFYETSYYGDTQPTALQNTQRVFSILFVLASLVLGIWQAVDMIVHYNHVQSHQANIRAHKIMHDLEATAIHNGNPLVVSDGDESVPVWKDGKVSKYTINDEIGQLTTNYYHLTENKPCIEKPHLVICDVDNSSYDALAFVPVD